MAAPVRSTLVLACWALVACTGDGVSNDACLPGSAPTLEIGLGVEGFSSVAPGGDFPLVHGPQGGYHLEIGLRATQIDASDLVVGHLTGSVGGVELASVDPWLDFRCDPAEEALISWGTLLIYDSTPDALDGSTTTVVAEVVDVQGTSVSVTTDFVIRDSP